MADLTWETDGQGNWRTKDHVWHVSETRHGDRFFKLQYGDWLAQRIGDITDDPESLKSLAQKLQNVIDEQETDRG